MFCVGTLTGVSPALHRYPVYGGQALRYAVGAVLLLLAARAAGLRHLRLSGREALLVLALAATGLAAFNIFIVEATRYADPAMVATIVATVPIILALIGPLQQRRQPTARIVLGAMFVVCGAALATGFGGGGPLGWLLALGALAGEVGFSLLAVPLLPRLGAIRVSAYSTLTAVPLLLAAGLAVDGRSVVRVPTWTETAAGYLAIVVTAFAFFCWYDALPRLGAERAGLFSGFLPIGAAASSMVLGTGRPEPGELAGIAVVIAGLAVGFRTPGTGRTASPAAEPSHAPATAPSRSPGPEGTADRPA
jgi:drug/metabolite transporter (DMT)-like permease